MKQFFVAAADGASGIDLDRKTFVARKRAEHELAEDLTTYFSSLSARTIVYKGMLTTPQLGAVLPRPRRPARRVRAAARALPVLDEHVPVVAAGPPVPLHRPQRRDQHGPGQPELDARPRGDGIEPAPARASTRRSRSARPGASDTARFDEVLELLHLGGRPIQHAMLMMIPEAWENHADDGRREARVLPVPLRR